jgi:hypothetical protein
VNGEKIARVLDIKIENSNEYLINHLKVKYSIFNPNVSELAFNN